MSLFEIGLFAFVIYIMVYSIIDRICKCAEHGHLASSYRRLADLEELSRER